MKKKALVTGASRGIGAAIARELANKGFHVYINYKNSEAEAVALALETGGTALRADVSEPSEVLGMFRRAGVLDALVVNAGLSYYGLFTDMDFDSWRRLFAVNVDGAYHCLQCALPEMIRAKSGSIVLVSSVWGLHGASCEAAYSATKSALNGLGKSLAKELGPSGIRVNCVAPGVIDTDMLNQLGEAERRSLSEATPLGRLGTARDVARLTAFLASEEADFITGQIIGADGGFPF